MCIRYEREVNQGHRSFLKKVAEKDDIATRPAVLCVYEIHPIEPSESIAAAAPDPRRPDPERT